MTFQNPVIVLPGITGTSLDDAYPIDRHELWSAVLHKEYERVALHPDDLRFEALEPARVVPGRLFDVVYGDLVDALRHDLSVRADLPTPVFPFPYDWRQPLQATARQLAAFIDEVLSRTLLLRHYAGFQASDGVDLVGHSMGGLVIAEYLAQCQDAEAAPRVRRVATLGAPFRGSIEAVVKLLTGLASLGGETPSEREREAARSTPAIYQLLPTYPGAMPDAAPSLLRADSWQSGVIDSLAEFVRLRAVRPPGSKAQRRARALELLQDLLDGAKQLRERAHALDLVGLGLAPDAWLAVVGIDSRTRTRLGWSLQGDQPRFDLGERENDLATGATGDGTVPLRGALPGFLAEESLVAVIPEDFEIFEVRDLALLGVAGFHAQLPNLNLAQRLVLRHLREDFKGPIWGRPIPGVDPEDWAPPIPRTPPSKRGIELRR